MGLVLAEIIHIALSVASAACIAAIFPQQINPLVLYACTFLVGVFVDSDHMIDYFLAFGFSFNVRNFFSGKQFRKSNKIYVFFHSAELLIIPAIIILFSNNSTLNIVALAMGMSFLLHLIYDTASNQMHPMAYFFVYRFFSNFELKKLVTSAHYKKHLQEKGHVHA